LRSYQTAIHKGPLELVSDDPLACDRCGTFALLHWSWGRRLCDACLARQHPTLTSDRRAGTLIRESLRVLAQLGLGAVAVALAPLPPVFVLRLIWQMPDSGDERADTIADLGPTLTTSVIGGFAVAMLTIALLQVLVGDGRPDYRAALRVVGSRTLSIAGLALALGIAGELLFLVLRYSAYVLVWLGSALAYPVLLHERVNPITAYMRSGYRLQGSYLTLLAATLVLGSPAFFGIVAFGFTAVLAPHSLSHVLTAALSGSWELFVLPLTALGAVLYVKLPPRFAEREPRD
jgi:hypothetical protein